MRVGFEQRNCLVTGSTTGIGLETARLLAADGGRVVVTGRREEKVEHARAEVGAALGIAADLSLPGAPAEVVSRVEVELGPVEILVNNVGVAYQRGFEELTDADWEELWQLNVMSYVRMIRAVVPECASAASGGSST